MWSAGQHDLPDQVHLRRANGEDRRQRRQYFVTGQKDLQHVQIA